MRTSGHCFIALFVASLFCGCATGPINCLNDECQQGAEPGSADWWAEKALLPPGVRQTCHKGKMWPPRPRPTVERQQFSHTFHSAHYWPLPYICQDREYVRNIVQIQERNGWEQSSTLFDRHFTEDQQLTVPGELHLKDILYVNPPEYRTVFVQSSFNPEIDSARVANVQQQLAQYTMGAEDIQVMIRKGRDFGRPASEVWDINDLYNSSIPTPRLGAAGGGGGGGGGGGAAGGATAAGAAAGP